MLLKSVIIASLVSTSFSLSVPDIISVFGKDGDIKGASVNLPNFQFSIVTNATHALVSLNQTQPSFKVGWMATAVGTQMKDADFLIAWPNAAGPTGPASVPWTISHRQSPNGESQPLLASTVAATSTNTFFKYLPHLSSEDNNLPYTVVSYLRLLTMPADYPSSSSFKSISRGPTTFIYASSTFQPQNIAESATLTQHDQAHAVTMLDLSTPISLGVAAAPPAAVGGVAPTGTAAAAAASSAAAAPVGIVSTDQTVEPRTRGDMILIAHATFGSLALLLFSPVGILVARFLRSSTWFPIHAAIQLTAASFVVIAFGLGYYASNAENFVDGHKRTGLAILILVIIQVILGSVAHLFIKPKAPSPTARLPTLSNKSPIRLLHIFLGLVITVLGFTQTRSGLDEWKEQSDAGTVVPKGVSIVIWILIALATIAYAAGWILEGMGRINVRREGDVNSEARGEKALHHNSSGETTPELNTRE